MPAIVAFLSQKGGVGKSTLSRSLAVVGMDVGLRVMLADLDPQQRTLLRWANARSQHGVEPAVEVAAFDHPEDALGSGRETDLLVLDLPGQLNDSFAGVAANAQLVVQPTSPSIDDLHPGVLVFQALRRVHIPRERLAFALCRVLADKEAEATRNFLQEQGYTVLRNALHERAAYREALNLGRALSETRQATLNASAREMMLDLLERALTASTANSTVKKHPERRSRRKA
jgi:chromosome partitioning protein